MRLGAMISVNMRSTFRAEAVPGDPRNWRVIERFAAGVNSARSDPDRAILGNLPEQTARDVANALNNGSRGTR